MASGPWVGVAAETARNRMKTRPRAVAARYDRRRNRVVLTSTTVWSSPSARSCRRSRWLHEAGLADIEITPTGLGLHWPRTRCQFWLPELLKVCLFTAFWMAGRMGRKGWTRTSQPPRFERQHAPTGAAADGHARKLFNPTRTVDAAHGSVGPRSGRASGMGLGCRQSTTTGAGNGRQTQSLA